MIPLPTNTNLLANLNAIMAHHDEEDDFSSDDSETSDSEQSGGEIEPFRLMDLPPELKLRIYSMALPRRTRIALDPKNIRHPGPFWGTRNNKPDIIALMQVSKTVYNEVIQLLYTTNTFCLIDPLASDQALSFIGTPALNNLRKLEVQVTNGLSDLGAIWGDLKQHCTKLAGLKLVFYHDHTNWLNTLADLALLPQPKPKLDLQLYASVWSQGIQSAPAVRSRIDRAFQAAERRAKVVKYDEMPKINLITIAASVAGDTGFAFLTYNRNGKPAFEAQLGKETVDPPRYCVRWKA
jgi:hypothetical protein